MECPSCSTPFPDDATFCPSCGWKVAGDPIDRAAHNLMKVSKEVLDTSLRFVEKSAKAIEPAVDRTVKKIEAVTKPVVEKTKPAVKKAAEASGYTAAAIRALVTARVGDKFEDKRRSVEQQLELFTEVGE